MLWDNTVNKAYRVKGEIQPLQNAAADGVRKDIGAFGEEVGFQNEACYDRGFTYRSVFFQPFGVTLTSDYALHFSAVIIKPFGCYRV